MAWHLPTWHEFCKKGFEGNLISHEWPLAGEHQSTGGKAGTHRGMLGVKPVIDTAERRTIATKNTRPERSVNACDGCRSNESVVLGGVTSSGPPPPPSLSTQLDSHVSARTPLLAAERSWIELGMSFFSPIRGIRTFTRCGCRFRGGHVCTA
jgi:hypothetical protein